MLFLPINSLPPKKSSTGIARGRHSGGYWLRAKSIGVQPRTDSQNLWRQVFKSSKLNWQSQGVGGANNAPINGTDPQSLWAMQAALYFGILQAGPWVNNVQSMATLVGCDTPEAYQVMVQNMRALLNLSMLPPPTFTSSNLTSSSGGQNSTIGSYLFVLEPVSVPEPNPLSISFSWQISVPHTVTGSFTLSVSGLPAGVTATFSENPAPLVYDPFNDTSECSPYVTLTLTPGAAAASVTATFTATGSTATCNFPVNVTIAPGSPVAALPPPTFAYPNSLYCSTVYDLNYNVVGFNLKYNAVGYTLYPMSRYGTEIPGLWAITASPQYTSSYSPPSVSSWKVILISGPFMPTPATLLAAWVETYGDLPDSGDISFQAQYVDPDTGCPGPALSCTASWQVGTLKSYDSAAWTGPTFNVSMALTDLGILAPGSSTGTIAVNAVNGYTGTVTMAAKSKTVLPNGANTSTKALPAGVTFTFSPPTVTFTAGGTVTQSVALTITAVSGCDQFSGPIAFEGSDSNITSSATQPVEIAGDVTPNLPSNYLNISPSNFAQSIAVNGTATVVFTLSNYGSDDQYVAMLATYPDSDISWSYAPQSVTVPGGSTSSPGTATCSLTLTAAAAATPGEQDLQIEASAGKNTTYALCGLTIT